MCMKKDPAAFRERFKAYKDGKKPYENGKTVIGSNVDMKDDGTFTDDYTRAFDDLIVTPKGPRVKPGQLHKYQEPWDDEKFMNAVTVGGLNNLSPSQWARRILDFQNGELTADSWLNGNNGIVPDDYAKEHPRMAAAANTLFDFWALGGPSMIKNAKNWAEVATTLGKQTPKQTFTFDLPEQQVAEEQKYIQQVNALENKQMLLPESSQSVLKPIAELPPEASYTGDVSKIIVPKEELGLHAHQILNPDIFTQELKGLPKPQWYDETFVDRNGKVNMRAITRAVKDFYKTHPNAASYKDITNNSGNLYQHIKDVVKSAQEIPVPKGYTRQELVQSALFHDIGKVFESGPSHDKISAEMLDDLGIDVTNNVKHAVKHHMSGGMLSRDELTKALRFADVARGESWDEAAFKYPHLAYEYKKPELNIPKIPYRDELKTRINPWLKNKGYETIPLDVSEEEAWQLLEERIDQHRSFLRGVRDPIKEKPTSPDDKRNLKNIIDEVMDQYGVDRDFAMSDDATDMRLEVAATTVSPSPTGPGRRSHLYDDERVDDGRTEYLRTHISRRIGADPNKKDALYVSTSDDTKNNYGTANTDNRAGTGYMVMLPKKERVPGESMSEHLLKNDFDMINIKSIDRGATRGTGSMYEDPYRLQTGRSLRSDMLKEGVIKPQYVDNWKIKVKPGNNALIRYGKRPSLLYYDQIEHYLNTANDLLQRLGVQFKLSTAKDGSIYMPQKLYDLQKDLRDLDAVKIALTPIKEFDPILGWDNDTQSLMYEMDDDFISPLTTFDKMSTEQSQSLEQNLIAMQDESYVKYMLGDNIIDNPRVKKYKLMYPHATLSQLVKKGYITQKQQSAIAKAYKHGGDPLKYINVKKIADKLVTDYLQSVKKNAHKSKRIDPNSLNATPKQMAEFLRNKGVVPRYEVEGYGENKVYVIDANPKNETRNAGDVKRTYGYILGNKGQKIVWPMENTGVEEKRYYSTGAGKDDGSYSKRKISRKTLRSIAPIIGAGSSILKPRQKDEKDKKD